MKHGTHPVDQLVEGDRLNDGWVVQDCIGDGDHALVTVRSPDDDRSATYRLPRKELVEVNRPK